MTSKTKIVVLHLKELIRTGIFVGLGIIAIILLIFLFGPDKNQNNSGTVTPEGSGDVSPGSQNSAGDLVSDSVPSTAQTSYIPGVYSTALVLGDHAVDVEVIVDSNNINSIRLVNLDEAITTMYPLLQPTFDSLITQIYEKQSLEGISYSDDSKYTSLVLLQAIEASLSKASPSGETHPDASLVQ